MQVIKLTTEIHAPIARCFELSLSIDLETEAGRSSRLRAIQGKVSGIIGLDEQVTWQAKQFGIWVTHTSVISQLYAPEFFEDTMIKGVFRFFRHQHTFQSISNQETVMRDHLTFVMPYGLIGTLLEASLVRRRVISLLCARNLLIKKMAESGR